VEVIIKDIKKQFGNKVALDIKELNIKQGQITGLIGPNGAGKSTLLRIIAGLDKDFSGYIKYNDQGLSDEIYKKMTLVTQKPYLFKRTVYENISYPLKIRKMDKKNIRILTEEIMTKLEISKLRNKKAHLLSGGESQKVSLARALVFEPRLLLLDEPTSNIDPESIKIMEREILRFNRHKKITIIIVTHNLEQAKRLCDKTIYMEKGKVGEINGFL